MADIRITITMTPDGQFNMTGPLDNKVVCYGLLEMAKVAVTHHQPSKIVRPNIIDPATYTGPT